MKTILVGFSYDDEVIYTQVSWAPEWWELADSSL
jgi:hypothetical protein